MVNVKLQTFEGPLALLLYLIRKEEMDIFNIDIHEITYQYLDYIKTINSFDLEVAGEFIAYGLDIDSHQIKNASS